MYDLTRDSTGNVKCRYRVPGPIVKDSLESATVGLETSGKTYTYTKAKPYKVWSAPDQPKLLAWITRPDGSRAQILRPALSELMIPLLSSDLIDTVDQIVAPDEWHASEDAIANSMEYGNLLLGVSALEAQDTVVMVRTVFIRLFNAIFDLYKAAKKLNIPATYDVLADLWLEYRYGWRPLIGEVTAMYDLLTAEKLSGVKSAYGGRLTLSDETTSTDINIINDQGYTLTYRVSLDLEAVSSKVGFCYLNVANSRNDDIWAQLGLDADSILSTAWDLVPFSFIVDMFLNISGLLQVSNHRDQVKSFNDYVSRNIYAKKIRIECVSVNGSPPEVIQFEPMSDRYLSERFTSKGLRNPAFWTSFWDAEYANTKSLYRKPFLPTALCRSIGRATVAINHKIRKLSDLVERGSFGIVGEYHTSSSDKATQYFRIKPNQLGVLSLGINEPVAKKFEVRLNQFLSQYNDTHSLEYVRTQVDKFFHIVSDSELGHFKDAANAALRKLNFKNPKDKEAIRLVKGDYPYFYYQVADANSDHPYFYASDLPISTLVTVGIIPGQDSEFTLNGELDYSPCLDSVIFERSLRKISQEFFEVNTELSAAQVVDLATIGEKLVRGRLKYR